MKITYYLILSISFISCEGVLFEEDLSERNISIIAPVANSELPEGAITFSWNPVEDATEYKLQIATPSFTNASQLVLDSIVTNLNFTTSLSEEAYEWRVKAQNESSETQYQTTPFTVFSEDAFQNRNVFVTAPVNNFVTNQPNVALQWQTVEEAMLYRVQVIDPTDNSIVLEETGAETSLVLSFPEGTYTWQVRAENDTESTQYTSQNITIDSVVPNIPTLLTPADAEVLADTMVIFTWSRDAVEGTIEEDVISIYSDAALTNLIEMATVQDTMYTANLVSGETYFWVVKAIDGAGNESATSTTFSFMIQ